MPPSTSSGRAKKKKQQIPDAVIVVKGILTVIFTVVMIVSIAGLYFSHVKPGGMEFGTMENSLSIMAIVLATMYWTRHADISFSAKVPYVEEWLVFVLLIITFCLSIVGVVKVHLSPNGPPFGTVESSLSILAFAITAKHVAKHIQWMLGRWVPPYPRKLMEKLL